MFGSDETAGQEKVQLPAAAETSESSPALDAPETENSETIPGFGRISDKKPSRSELKEDEFFIPAGELIRLGRPTDDGSERGTAAVFEVNEDGEGKSVSKIFLYYDNFQISRSINGLTTCDVRFFVLTSLNSRLISLDAKLVWPEISTAVSFANVMPNTPTYYNYTLIGDGCYSMDKMPNIIVNRCRVRGLSSAECANKIVWLSRTK